jgi:hypothetical protein
MLARLVPRHGEDEIAALLAERRFVVLQGPPGTGKTHLARKVAAKHDGDTFIQFHPARTYEDFVVGLAPRPAAGSRRLRLEPGLRVLGTLNTADRSIARLDLAIRRRFAFVDVWPDLALVRAEGDALAQARFEDALDTFSEHADDAGLALIPGHAYFLDPRPQLGAERRAERIRLRLRHELLPLLRAYVDERLLGPATGEIAGLADRTEAALDGAGA